MTLALAAGVKALIDESVRARRTIGSRRLATPFGLGAEVSDFADSPSQVVARLIAGGGAIDAIVRGAFKEISDHQRGVTEAALTAARRLGEELAPAALGAEAHSLEGKAHLWDLYCVLWRALDPDWAAAFLEAYRLHFGEAYDDVTVHRHLSSAEPRP